MNNKKIFKMAVLVFLFCFSACTRVALHQDLKENDANEILVALHDRGIEAKKTREEKSQQVSWSIEVLAKDEPLARKILVDNKLPKTRELGFSGICKEKALIPTPEEEKCRRLLALKGEIINSLQSIPGVVEADVVLNIPEVSEFAVESQPNKHPTASVVIRVRKSADGSDLTEAKVQRFISNAVENLDPRDVAAIITYVDNPNLVVAAEKMVNFVSYMGLQISPESKNRFKIYSLSTLGIFIFLSGALIFTLFRLIQLRQNSSQDDNQSGRRNGGGGADPRLLGAPDSGSNDIPLISDVGSQNLK
ncbi:MAG: hypothetical protein HQM15_10180 [Deltaproteobacteria bacterium]|nr:hypothetical protein [Deltaproteobacteria bacterium]